MAQESWEREQGSAGCKQQQPGRSVACVNKCGFFGNSTTLNMCAKCYRSHIMKASEEPDAPASTSPDMAPPPVPEAAALSTSGNSCSSNPYRSDPASERTASVASTPSDHAAQNPRSPSSGRSGESLSKEEPARIGAVRHLPHGECLMVPNFTVGKSDDVASKLPRSSSACSQPLPVPALQPVSSPPPSSPSAPTPAIAISSTSSPHKCLSPSRVSPISLSPPALVSTSSASVSAAATTCPSAPRPAHTHQTNRCQACRKRVGLTGFKCRCNGLFCGVHRYADQHACTFDYKAAGREAIARANPVVKADKVIRF